MPNNPAQIYRNGVLEPATTRPGEVTWDQSISWRAAAGSTLGTKPTKTIPSPARSAMSRYSTRD
jgi:hypothetical protein